MLIRNAIWMQRDSQTVLVVSAGYTVALHSLEANQTLIKKSREPLNINIIGNVQAESNIAVRAETYWGGTQSHVLERKEEEAKIIRFEPF